MAKTEKIVDLKSKAEKITDEQLKKVQDTVNNLNRSQLEIGSMEIKKHEMMHQIAGLRDGLTVLQGEFEKEYGHTDFEVSEEFGRYTITPINNPKFASAYERDRQKQINRREKGIGWQRSDNMGNKTDKWS